MWRFNTWWLCHPASDFLLWYYQIITSVAWTQQFFLRLAQSWSNVCDAGPVLGLYQHWVCYNIANTAHYPCVNVWTLAQRLQRWPNIKHGMHSSLAVETAWSMHPVPSGQTVSLPVADNWIDEDGSMWCVAYNNVVYVPADRECWLKVAPVSHAVGQHWPSIASMSHAC